MQRTVRPLRQQPIRRQRRQHVRRLYRNDDVSEALVLQQLEMAERRTAERLLDRQRPGAHLRVKLLFEAPEVDADADRHALRLRRSRHGLHAVASPDVAWIQAQRVRPRLDRRERAPIVEMNVGHKGNRRGGTDFAEHLRRLQVGNRQAVEVAPEVGAALDLRQDAGPVVRIDVAHRLHAHGSTAADRKTADADGTGRSRTHRRPPVGQAQSRRQDRPHGECASCAASQ